VTPTLEARRPPLTIAARPGAPLGAIFLGLGGLAAVAVGILHLDRLPFTVCVFKAATGLACLTCGTTRALGRLAHLDVAGALTMNPLATLFALALVPWGIADLLLLPRNQALSVEVSPGVGNVLRCLAVALALANWGYLIAAGR